MSERSMLMTGETSVIITLRDIVGKKKVGGIGHYYISLRPHLTKDECYFTVGKRNGKVGLFRALFQLCFDYSRLWRAIGKEGLKLVHVNPSLSRNCLFRDGFSIMLARVRGKKTLVFFHGWEDETCRKIEKRWLWLFRRTYGRADGVLVLSQDFGRQLRTWGYSGPVFVETTAVEDSLGQDNGLSAGKRNASGPLRLLFLARIEKDKGIFVAIDSFVELSRRWPGRFELIVAGDGSERERAQSYVQEKRISGVRFMGYVSGSEKVKVYREADIYVFPSSHGEGMPISVLEAMACGLPVVTTPVGGLSDFFEDGKMGYLVESPDAESFANSILRLSEDQEARMKMAGYSADFAAKYFLASAVAKRIERIWEAVVDGKIKARRTALWFRDSGI